MCIILTDSGTEVGAVQGGAYVYDDGLGTGAVCQILNEVVVGLIA